MSNSQGIYWPMGSLPLFHTSILLQLCPWYRSGWNGVNVDNFLNGNMCFFAWCSCTCTPCLASKGGRKRSGGTCKKKSR